MRCALILICAMALTAACGFLDDSDKPEAQPGLKASSDWIALLDGGNYTGSWAAAAVYFRTAVPQDQWVMSMNAFRAPMGATTTRKVKSARLATTLPGAPDGQYLLIQYMTEFANKKSAVETTTVMRETNGVWSVSGYFVR